jgi:membrane protease YdiL (CAAX protease family)
MDGLSAVHASPAPGPLLGYLVAGFVMLVVGLAVLTLRRGRLPALASPAATRRALLYAIVFGLCSASFSRVIEGALLGRDHSPWLLALGDVMFVTLALFAWVMVLAENLKLPELGFRGGRPGQVVLATLLGLGGSALYAVGPVRALVAGHAPITSDGLVFSLLFATAGSALPEEMLFRGFLMGSMNGRVRRWARVAVPALVFTAVRSGRFVPGASLAPAEWLFYVFGVVLPLGLWWGLMRDLAGGSLWPCLISHAALDFCTALAKSSP